VIGECLQFTARECRELLHDPREHGPHLMLSWRVNGAQELAWLHVPRATRAHERPLVLDLPSPRQAIGEIARRPRVQTIMAVARVANLAGYQWFVTCPHCCRAVRSLYLPLPLSLSWQFECRQCHGLRYASQLRNPEQRADAAVLRMARRINPNVRGDLEVAPPKPPRMRWSRYWVLCERFGEARERRDDVYNLSMLNFLMRVVPAVERERWSAMRACLTGVPNYGPI
jgi:hypothetical protein